MVIGSINLFAGAAAPSGYLVCNGAAVSRSTYSELFDTIGTMYGAGDGSTTFNLPDLTGKVAMGCSSTYLQGVAGGEETHALTSSEIPAHAHTMEAHTHGSSIVFNTPVLAHTITQPAFTYSQPSGSQNIGSTYSIRCYVGKTSTNASRTTDVAVTAHAASDCTMSGSITDCDPFDTNETGEDTAHNNMQPYITMLYVIYAGEAV